MKKIEIIKTEDGSHTISVPSLEETYHSIHGALQESKHVYINAGINFYRAQNPSTTALKILEFGYGTGLNCLLTAVNNAGDCTIHYHSLDKYPLEAKIIKQLNYGELLNAQELFNKINFAQWDTELEINKYFFLRKIKVDFRDFSTIDQYNIIYFDAFAPDKQPELWTKSIFSRCYQLLNKRGVLVTYSAKGQLKRDLKSVGFLVESLPGPPGKFEITRAVKH